MTSARVQTVARTTPQITQGLRTFEDGYRRARLKDLFTLCVQVLIVDGANVVGSRPDGWWRDRSGAARRLRERLMAAALPHDEVVLVLEDRDAGQPCWAGRATAYRHVPGSGTTPLWRP